MKRGGASVVGAGSEPARAFRPCIPHSAPASRPCIHSIHSAPASRILPVHPASCIPPLHPRIPPLHPFHPFRPCIPHPRIPPLHPFRILHRARASIPHRAFRIHSASCIQGGFRTRPIPCIALRNRSVGSSVHKFRTRPIPCIAPASCIPHRVSCIATVPLPPIYRRKKNDAGNHLAGVGTKGVVQI